MAAPGSIAYKKWYDANKSTQAERVLRRKKELRLWFDALKAELSCERCGENHPACLDFHHRDPTTKDSSLADVIFRKGWGKARILAEVEKCDVLCANCHRKEHFASKA